MLKRFLFLVLFCSFAGMAVAQTDKQEANLKAVFIYNFTRYVDWDSSGTNDDFVVGVVGPSPIIAPLVEIAKSKTVNNKRIIVRVYNKPDEIRNCNIVFIPQNSRFLLSSILDRCGRGVLTISEEEGYAKQGTAFNFVLVNDKLKFEANLRALYLAGLKAGSQLLKLAIIIE